MPAKSKVVAKERLPDGYRYVVLRLWHKDLDPDKITKALGIEPDASWRRGPALNDDGEIVINKRTGKPYKNVYGQWNLTSFVRGNARLDTRIKDIIEQIKPKRAILRKILREVNADLNIAVEPHRGLAVWGHTFYSDIINEFTSLGIDIHFSIHMPHYTAS